MLLLLFVFVDDGVVDWLVLYDWTPFAVAKNDCWLMNGVVCGWWCWWWRLCDNGCCCWWRCDEWFFGSIKLPCKLLWWPISFESKLADCEAERNCDDGSGGGRGGGGNEEGPIVPLLFDNELEYPDDEEEDDEDDDEEEKPVVGGRLLGVIFDDDRLFRCLLR